MKKKNIVFLFLAFCLIFFQIDSVKAEELSNRLKGKILLQVENKGEAWYVEPISAQRYYLGTPADIFRIMREKGLGISNDDFSRLDKESLKSLAGRILLKVEDKGQAYYINPDNPELNYLGRPEDAFKLMPELGLGITNEDLNKINLPPLSLYNLDKNVNPGEDFYQYAVGNWLKNNPVPAEFSWWSSFSILRDENKKLLFDLMESLVGDGRIAANSVEEKVRNLYVFAMDEKNVNELGVKPLLPELEKIDSINDWPSFSSEVARLHLYLTTGPLFYIFSSIDIEDSQKHMARLWQTDLGATNRDYYLDDDDRTKEIRAKYSEYLKNMFVLLGDSDQAAGDKALIVMDIETKLAKISNSNVDNRDPIKTNNKISIEELKTICPNFYWETYFKELGLESLTEINISQPDYFKNLSGLLTEIPRDQWKVYLKWELINSQADYLSDEFVKESFNFYNKFLSGQNEILPRWKRAVSAVSDSLGEAVGQLYVKKYFSPEAKEEVLKIADNIKAAFAERIKRLDWMSEQTKQEALKKLSAMKIKVGYPDEWIDYSDLKIDGDSYVANIIKTNYFNTKIDLAKINKPVSDSEWWQYPQTVNAGYTMGTNEMLFPAAILQPPFFDIEADEALNYGGIGAVIGHEMTHGFDDMGRKYDITGNLKNWWTEEDENKFNEKIKILVEQFNNYSPLEGYNIDGELTLGENIADLGGLSLSFSAFKKVLENKINQAGGIKQIDGFTPEQRFFLSNAQVWKNNIRDDYLKYILKNDVHSPGKYRVNGPMSNLPEFAEAFNISPLSPMTREESQRAKIW